MLPADAINTFISRWSKSEAAERANYQLFLAELCDVLGVPRPDPAGATTENNAYVFERSVTFNNGDGKTSTGRIDLYKRDCFVVEAKQGSEKAAADALGAKKKKSKGTATRGTEKWDQAMMAARGQAEQYVRALPADEGNPPFIIVVDIGHSFEILSDFSRAGKTYIPFPDARNYKIPIKDLEKPEILDRLRRIWSDPMSLDPSRVSAEVTREVAARLAALARSLESSGHDPHDVAGFLMRCLFTMFAEDVKLLPERAFTELLEGLVASRDVEIFPEMVSSLWQAMDKGTFHPLVRKKLLQFNGGLFEDTSALPLTIEQLQLLVDAAKSDWRNVEPAIFGTLLERALDPIERHKLGAHYTPRAYVERLVMPTLVEPLRAEWDAVRATAVTLARGGDEKGALKELRIFHHALCTTRVLDPACGSGNFLYVALEHMKRLEGEVLEMMEGFGENVHSLELTTLTVDPHQFLGIEINPRAATIAEMVLWIGYLQWHFRTHGDTQPLEPVLHAYHNIENRDAVLAYDAVEPLLDADNNPVTRWDGRTTKKHPVTGEDVPDETARVAVLKYINPRKAEWPEAEYIVGNPPFLGPAMMRQALGDGYTEAIRKVYKELPDSIDFVMYWWHKAADLLQAGKAQRFGFIATNSLRQTFNRRVLAMHMEGEKSISLAVAIPDHPWVDSTDGAAVRISMTVAQPDRTTGRVGTVSGANETKNGIDRVYLSEQYGPITSNLTIGVDLDSALQLQANRDLSNRGVSLFGSGFIVTRPQKAF